ncbi:hypothetical protein EHF33_20685 (plasmid) [Deinococcus psychrotolerans]|uniref:Uncharacterized protein n=1 Tax=Deinococcus psychrotolerans TaxID=2489213 RepID=A0A3G8YJ91_9DEIO|nr:hypothetical protein [Deinococcus psychrotolerans]AZI45329.1 hypothetical protein EHF33_20685 [Deinococcus psychrotolerans]
MSLLSEVLGAVQSIQQDPELNALRFRHSATWSDGTTCRFSVQDPAKDGRSGPQKLSTHPLEASLRRLKVHPDDVQPAPGASTPYQGGKLVRGFQTDTSDFTGQQTGVCRLVDARAYPVLAVSKAGQRLRLLIIAGRADPLSAGSGAQDVRAELNASHTGHTPPGVVFQVGEQFVTSDGDRYTITPPVQRDVLGDTLGLSYQGSELAPTIPDEGQPPAPPAPDPADSEDPWWTENP